MNIRQFKVGDIITRNEPVTNKHNKHIDGSYTGERLMFLGYDEESKIIFLGSTDSWHMGEPITLSYARDNWDEGWTYFPITLWEKVRGMIAKP